MAEVTNALQQLLTTTCTLTCCMLPAGLWLMAAAWRKATR